MKLAVVGGGSTYTPELVDGLGRLQDVLPFDELVLVDPAEDRLELVGGFGQRILDRLGHPGTLTTSAELEPALDGVDAVLLQLRIGGQAARHQDETWPLECGCVGQETTGAGGLAKALRTVPVVLDIAERVRKAAPDAWIIDFTNPVGIVTRGLLNEGHRAVGLCNVAIGFQRKLASILGVEPQQLELDHVGLNHLTWERAARVDGTDRLPQILAGHAAELAEDIKLPAGLMTSLGVIPSYYLRYFYAHDEVVRELVEAGAAGSRATAVTAVETELLALYADPTLDTKPDLLAQRGGAYYSEAAVQLAASLLGTGATPAPQVVNLRNNGTLPFLPDDAVIEVPAHVDHTGVRAVDVAPLEPLYAGLVSAVTSYEHLALDAALRGGRQRVFEALLAHPLVGQAELADGLTDRLIAHNREHLPWA
ncbi:6-phospho-beta-glucosidase [Luteipulveratus mongoliensis]|uniref:6-phospho-beta-glucosidase n=1 Tax=Luteipulveratus mongoliensis TaxID=571913 RepID=A0A0K1JDQ7_9MICO|nr:6-phospho-beta-glucosidase [Luteipulveratus mongoliensis]AKU14723.1 6-phospho-beta-glucosidase [Luteipulveratus mongoliensis]